MTEAALQQLARACGKSEIGAAGAIDHAATPMMMAMEGALACPVHAADAACAACG